MTVVDAESRFHVLAVDDSIVDRKLIEMLLKNSSYPGEPPPRRHLAAPQPQQDRDSVCPSCPCFLELELSFFSSFSWRNSLSSSVSNRVLVQ